MSSQDTLELCTTLAQDLWSAWVRAEQSRADTPGCTCKAPEHLLSSQPHEQEYPSVTHYTAGQEQHLKCTSLNSPFIFPPSGLTWRPWSLEANGKPSISSTRLSTRIHIVTVAALGMCHFSYSLRVQYWISHIPTTLRKRSRQRVLECIMAIVRNGNIMEKQEM